MIIERNRIFLIFSTIFYILVFKFTYELSISPRWIYFGLGFSPPPPLFEISSFIFAIVPLFWAPISFFRPSAILYYIQYTLVYIPILLVCYHVNRPNLSDLNCLKISTCIFLGMLILTFSYVFSAKKIIPSFKIKQTYRITYFGLFLSLLALWFVGLKTNSSLSIAFDSGDSSNKVGAKIFETANSARGNFSTTATLLGGRTFIYSMFWLSGFFLPLVFAYGIFMKKKLNFLIFIFGYLFLFVFAGYKSSLVAIFSLPAVWFFVSRRSNGPSILLFACSIYLLISIYFNSDYISNTQIGSWAKMLSDWVNLRIFCISPLTHVQFFDFFQTNPLTYMSHVKGFNLLIDYPYVQDIGKYVGRFHYGGGINVNAGLWATDGIAAFGLFGIITSSIFLSFVFWVIDSVSKGFNPKFVVLLLGYIAITFTNTSIFTNFITGGLFLIILTLYFMPSSTKIKTWLL